MTDDQKNRLIWGLMLLIGALGSVSLRNNPALGITPFSVGVIQGAVFGCLILAVRLADRRIALVIAIVEPVYLWMQRFLDGFMVPVEVLVNMAVVGSVSLMLRKPWHYLVKTAAVTAFSFLILLSGSGAAIRIVKEESIVRALIVAWNMTAYSSLSILGAALLCMPFKLNRTPVKK